MAESLLLRLTYFERYNFQNWVPIVVVCQMELDAC